MKDRIVEHPARYQLVPVAGTTDQFDFVPVPGTITEAGTDLSKENLLSDATAAALGLSGDPTVDYAILQIANNGLLRNRYYWEKYARSYTVNETPVSSRRVGNSTTTFYYSNSYTEANGAIELDSPSTIILDNGDSGNITLNNKYFTSSFDSHSIVYHGNNTALTVGGYDLYKECSILSVAITDTFDSIVWAYTSDGYPDFSTEDGYYYIPLGKLEMCSQIATGSYTGTGTFGSSNKNSIVSSFAVKMIFIISDTDGDFGFIIPASATGFVQVVNSQYAGKNVVSVSGNTTYWYNASDYNPQLNASGKTYRYVIVG